MSLQNNIDYKNTVKLFICYIIYILTIRTYINIYYFSVIC